MNEIDCVNSGVCATFVVIRKNKVYSGHIGDARVLIGTTLIYYIQKI
jgi:serine/threonine protein phosphatase PrpC